MFSTSNRPISSYLGQSNPVNKEPVCVVVLRENRSFIHKLNTCLEPTETASRAKFGKCRHRCCLKCPEDKCLNSKTRKVLNKRTGEIEEREYNSYCTTASKLLTLYGGELDAGQGR